VVVEGKPRRIDPGRGDRPAAVRELEPAVPLRHVDEYRLDPVVARPGIENELPTLYAGQRSKQRDHAPEVS